MTRPDCSHSQESLRQVGTRAPSVLTVLSARLLDPMEMHWVCSLLKLSLEENRTLRKRNGTRLTERSYRGRDQRHRTSAGGHSGQTVRIPRLPSSPTCPLTVPGHRTSDTSEGPPWTGAEGPGTHSDGGFWQAWHVTRPPQKVPMRKFLRRVKSDQPNTCLGPSPCSG